MAEQLIEPRRIYAEVTDTPTSYVREGEGAHPPMDRKPYKSTALRHPQQPLVFLPQTITDVTRPALGERCEVGELDHGLTRQHAGEPIGERIVVSGRVLDTEGKPLARTLVEIWQANAAGRYLHRGDRWAAPLDPNFSGAGRCVTDALAERHRHTPMMARKLLQDAVPTSFGLLAAHWMTAIDGGSAAAWARDMLEHLDVYAEAMRSGAGPDPDLGAASQLIDRALVNHRA